MHDKIRYLILKAAHLSKASHIGSALSIVEILEALYFNVANISKENFSKEDRDRIILSKGHGSLALYCTLALKGIMPIEYLDAYLVDGGKLPCHIDMNCANGLEASTGSLGHGLGLAEGMALANRIKGIKSRIFVIIGDGEFQEGSILEALNSIGSKHLNEVTIILDNNQFQSYAKTSEVVNVKNYKKIFEALDFNTFEVDGHNVDELTAALKKQNEKPLAIIANTLKGKGFSFMENTLASHYMKIDNKKFEIAMSEIKGAIL
jgi:transketolase